MMVSRPSAHSVIHAAPLHLICCIS